MQLDCKFCLICFKELSQVKILVKRGRKRKDEEFNRRRKSASSIKLLLTYLLNSRSNTYASILKEILKLSGVETDEGKEGERLNVSKCVNYFRLCENCEGIAQGILERHLELEKLQMRIVHDVKSVKEAILRSSGWLGGIVGENGEEAFEHFSKKFCDADYSSDAKKIFEILKEFQAAVSETGKASILVPLVYLEKYSVAQASQTLFPGCTASADIVKIEPQPIISQYDDDAGSYHEDIFPLLDDANIDIGNVKSDLDQLDKNIFPEDNNAPITDTVISPPVPNHQPVKRKRGSKAGTKFKKRDKAVVKMLKMKRKPMPSSYSCEECSETFRSKFILCSHKIKKHGASKLACEVCGIQFVDYGRLYYHRKTEHNWTNQKEAPPVKKKGRFKLPKRGVEDPNIPMVIRSHKRNFACDTCKGKFKHRLSSRFEQHLRGHETEEKAFHCDECNLGFTTKQHFTFHQGQHQGYHKLICDVCRDFFNPFELEAHMKTHVEDDKIFPCSYCSQCLASMDRLIIHIIKNHQVENGIKMKCVVCEDRFDTKTDMLQHLHDVHKAVEKIRCEFEGCDKTFFESSTYRMHWNFHIGKFTCAKCLKKFYHKNGLEAHQKVHDTEKQEVFQCDQCPDTFQSSRRLQAHKMKEHGAAKLPCDICGKEYISYEGLQYHRKKDHEGTGGLHCPICNKNMPTTYDLRRHTEAVHSVGKNYVCEECGKAFRTLDKCKIHKQIHGGKNHQCPHCAKAFTRRDNLVLHIRTHTGEKPYNCDGCGRGFATKGTMNTHRQKCSINLSSGRVKN